MKMRSAMHRSSYMRGCIYILCETFKAVCVTLCRSCYLLSRYEEISVAIQMCVHMLCLILMHVSAGAGSNVRLFLYEDVQRFRINVRA